MMPSLSPFRTYTWSWQTHRNCWLPCASRIYLQKHPYQNILIMNIFCAYFESVKKSKSTIQCSNFVIIASHVFGKVSVRNLKHLSQICLWFFFFFWFILLQIIGISTIPPPHPHHLSLSLSLSLYIYIYNRVFKLRILMCYSKDFIRYINCTFGLWNMIFI